MERDCLELKSPSVMELIEDAVYVRDGRESMWVEMWRTFLHG
jgi:hypothetical protein